MKIVKIITLILVTLTFNCSCYSQKQLSYNVLLITVDDLKPAIGSFGDTLVKTPHMDKLSSKGMIFTNAYAQQAVCAPSRASMLSGKRPESIQVMDLETPIRKQNPDIETLPQFFKNNGYLTYGMGKVFHHLEPTSFTEPEWYFRQPLFSPQKTVEIERMIDSLKNAGADWSDWTQRRRGPSVEIADVPDSIMRDGELAVRAIEKLKALKKENEKEKPFFLALGFLKPHLPFVAPKRYWDLYDPEKIPLATNQFAPKDAPYYAQHWSGELRTYDDIPKEGPFSDSLQLVLKHGYLAATSFVDAQIGLVIQELERLGLDKNTIIVLWGDHGFQLGEHNMWTKQNNYDISLRAPLIISVPGMKNTGSASSELVEFVDIFPTLAELANLEAPDDLEGISIASLLENPDRPVKEAVFSIYPWDIPGVGKGFGYTMKTQSYRLVKWFVPDTDFVEYELYDHISDPDENVNVANQSDYSKILDDLIIKMEEGWENSIIN